MDASIVEIFNAIWPVLVAVFGAIVLFSRAFNRLDVLEEKVKTLFELFNNKLK